MKNILQVQAKPLHFDNVVVWFDLLELPNSINNMRELIEAAKKDHPDRKVRIIQLLEEIE